jgi:hypothetical protein
MNSTFGDTWELLIEAGLMGNHMDRVVKEI